MADATIVTITGIGNSQSVEASDSATLGDVLREAGIDVDAVKVTVNGNEAAADQPIENGDQVQATPRDTKLG
jgi:sulfur carrier protein ThiS